MTVSTTTASKIVVGNGATTSFPLQFPVVTAAELTVTRYNATTDTEVTLTLDVDYSVSGTGFGNSATVTYPLTGDPLPSTQTLRFKRNTTRTQTLDIWQGGAFLPEAVEEGLDRAFLIAQEIKDTSDRALVVPVGESGYVLPDISERAGLLLGFDQDGDPTLVPVSGLSVSDFVTSLGLEFPVNGTDTSLYILSDGQNLSGGPRAIEMRIATGADEGTHSAVLLRKRFQSTGAPAGGIGHNVQTQTFQETYNEQNVWGLSHTLTQTSPRGSANGVGITSAVTRELEWDGTAWQSGSVGDPIDGQVWGHHVPIKDTIKYDDFGIDPLPLVNEWSAGVWNHDVTTNRVLKTIAAANAGSTKNAKYGLGAVGNRVLHTMTAWGWDADAELGAAILIKTNSPGGGDGNRSWTNPETEVSYSDDYGSFRYGIVMDDLQGRTDGNPGIIGVGLYIANGGESCIELYGDPEYGIKIRGTPSTAAIDINTISAFGISLEGGTYTNDRAIKIGDDMRICFSDDNTKFIRWNSSNNRLEFVDGGTVRGYVDMSAAGSGGVMN